MTSLNATSVTAARANGAGVAVNNGVAFAVNPDGGTTFNAGSFITA
jgi:hypothetical protein